MQKRGQFFLIAAVVIIFILIGLTTIYISAKSQKKDKSVFDLSNEINLEASVVADSGTFYSLSQEELNNRTVNLTDYYASIYPDTDFAIVYGNSTDLYIRIYNSTNIGEISIGYQTSTITHRTILTKTKNPESESEAIEITFNNVNYSFNLQEGQNFFLVLKKTKGEDEIVV